MKSTWHTIPKDDAWKQVMLARMEEAGTKLWLMCDARLRTVYPEPRAFAEEHGLDMTTPLPTISLRLRCTKCGERKAHFRPEPYRGRE